ncbi:NAD-dependent epimerase/dehydratase family protein [Williamsia maris]|uniref:dTDP-L-rhamnose 4-epimerase n=1 Tax=Williamsia maris TaxID=72806 RepID=A0ABT1HDW9_9NOCA|nr:NAD-dependent epimerase/dehydratase family protein [Williamsia maris]MCP2176438.1 dTDP-L-rhamnose 4-epimerase [Williamsia maris]
MSTVLLTGAAGFIGSHIRAQLEARGHEVVAVDGMIPAAHGPDAIAPEGVAVANLRTADIDSMLRGVDVVCHQAAMVGAGVDARDAPDYAADNDLVTARLLAAMYRAGVSRLVLASSMVVYGDGTYTDAVGATVDPPARTTEALEAGHFERYLADGTPAQWALTPESAPIAPRSYYAASKAAQEAFAKAWTLETGGQVTALRYHNVYGPHMPRDTPYAGVAAIFRSQLESGMAPTVFEDGGQMRDFVHVDDIARANVTAIESTPPGFDAFNVCSGQPITIGEVAAELCKAIDGPDPVTTGRFRPGDVRHIVADPARATEVLGFTASVSPADGIAAFATAPLR